MATTTAQPTGTASPDDWPTLVGAATKYEACQSPDDDVTSYVSSSATINQIQTFTGTPPTIATGDTVTQVVLTIRAIRGAAGTTNLRIGYAFNIDGGGTQSGLSGSLTTTDGSWATLTYTHSGLSAAWGGGLSWYVETLNARLTRASTFTVELTYTPAGGKPAIYYAMMQAN